MTIRRVALLAGERRRMPEAPFSVEELPITGPVTIDPPPQYFLAEQKSPYAEIANKEVHKKYVNPQPHLQGFESQIKRR